MKNQILSLAFLSAFSMQVMGQQSLTVKVSNPTKKERKDVPVVLSLAKYGDVQKAVVTVDGKEIPSQLDDINVDMTNDELCFLVNLDKKEAKTYQIKLFQEGTQNQYPERTFAELCLPSRNKKLAKNKQDIYLRSITFDQRTVDPYHYVHSHGLCFESELIALRVYFDHRQTMDIYGKTRKGLVVYDTQFYPSEEQLKAGSGDDVLWVGNTYGLGALRGWDGSKSLMLDQVKYRTQRVISEGPLRAIVEVEDKGWTPAPGLKPVTAIIRYTIYAGHRDFNCDVFFDKDVSNYRFSTGLINVKNSTEFSDKAGLRGCYGMDWPTGKDDGIHKLETVGLGIYVPMKYLESEKQANVNDLTYVVKPSDNKISYKLAYTSANENFGFKNEKEWYKWLKDWKEDNEAPVVIEVK